MESSTDESGSHTSSSEYATVWSSPPKKPTGRSKFRETRHPIYKGVRRRGNSNRWICEVRELHTRSRIWVGTFASAEMAARAYDVAAIALRGTVACLNFTDSAWLIDIPSSFANVQELKCTAINVAKTLNGIENGKTETDGSSRSTSQVSDETEVVSGTPVCDEETSDSDGFDQIEFELDINGEMDMGLYYASLAQGLLMEPPMGSYEGWNEDEDEERTEMSLWSYLV